MFWLKSITAEVLWSNESGRVSCLCIPLISWHWRTKTVLTTLVLNMFVCNSSQASPVLSSAEPGDSCQTRQDNKCKVMTVFYTIISFMTHSVSPSSQSCICFLLFLFLLYSVFTIVVREVLVGYPQQHDEQHDRYFVRSEIWPSKNYIDIG